MVRAVEALGWPSSGMLAVTVREEGEEVSLKCCWQFRISATVAEAA